MSGDDAVEKFVSNDAKKATTEDTHLLENVSELSSKSSLIYMRKKVHQVKEESSPGAQRREWEGQRRVEEHCSKIFTDRKQQCKTAEGHKISGDNTARVPRCCGDQECRGEVVVGGESKVGENHGAPGALLHRRYCGLRTATAVKCLSDNEDFNVVYLVTFPTWRTIRRCRAA